jgi:predicted site-specific integrase-resolvase
MSAREFAGLEDVSYFTVLRWIRLGILKAVRHQSGRLMWWEITPAAIKGFKRPIAGRRRNT